MTKFYVSMQNRIAEAKEDRGAAMAEYGLLLALVALAAIVILGTFGDSISSVFTEANNDLQEGIADAQGGGGGGGGGDAGGDAGAGG